MLNDKTAVELVKLIKKAINALNRQQAESLRLGKLLLIKDGKTERLQLKTVGGDVVDNAAFLEPYGLSAKPKADGNSLGLILAVNGNPANTVVLAIHNRELRFKGLKDGEVALYDEFGNYVHLQKNGNMKICCPNKIFATCKELELNAQTANVNADIINLGGEGCKPVARLGDTVEVDPNTHKGVITSGSLGVNAK